MDFKQYQNVLNKVGCKIQVMGPNNRRPRFTTLRWFVFASGDEQLPTIHRIKA